MSSTTQPTTEKPSTDPSRATDSAEDALALADVPETLFDMLCASYGLGETYVMNPGGSGLLVTVQHLDPHRAGFAGAIAFRTIKGQEIFSVWAIVPKKATDNCPSHIAQIFHKKTQDEDNVYLQTAAMGGLPLADPTGKFVAVIITEAIQLLGKVPKS